MPLAPLPGATWCCPSFPRFPLLIIIYTKVCSKFKPRGGGSRPPRLCQYSTRFSIDSLRSRPCCWYSPRWMSRRLQSLRQLPRACRPVMEPSRTKSQPLSCASEVNCDILGCIAAVLACLSCSRAMVGERGARWLSAAHVVEDACMTCHRGCWMSLPANMG